MFRLLALGGLVATLATTSLAAGPQPPWKSEVHGATETARSMADHALIAHRFEKDAADLEKHAGEHERLAERYRNGIRAAPKVEAESFAEHRTRISQSLRKAAREARTLSQIHRDVSHQIAR